MEPSASFFDSPIRARRTEQGLSQVDLAVKAGVSLSTVRLAEYGITTTRTLNKIAPVLGASVDELRGRPLNGHGAAPPATNVVHR